MFETNPPSHPEYAQGLPPDQDDWTGAQWVVYHKRLKAAFGAASATDIVNIDLQNTSSTSTIYWTATDCNWYRYAKANGLIVYNGVMASVYCGVAGVGDTANNATDAADTLSKLIVPVAVVALVGVGVYSYNRYIKPQRRRRKRTRK